MTLKANYVLMLLATAATFAGCQSGPSWAWWKHDKGPDPSAVAKSAEPALPSAQSSPQAVAVAGLTPASPPSSANLAAASATPAGSATRTSPATAANPQVPPFSPANSLADKLTSANPLTKSAAGSLATPSPTTPPGTQASQSLASVPPGGPYDPKGYKPSAPPTANSDLVGLGSSGDRYGMGSTSNGYASSPAAKPVQTASAPENRYGSLNAMNPSTPTTPIAAGASPAAAPTVAQPAPASLDRYSTSSPTSSAPSAAQSPISPLSRIATPSAVAVSPSALPTTSATASAPQSIQLTSAPGGYRPGGTSTYVGTSVVQPIEIATRPAPPTSPGAAIPTTNTPGTSTQPWAPTTAPATRTY